MSLLFFSLSLSFFPLWYDLRVRFPLFLLSFWCEILEKERETKGAQVSLSAEKKVFFELRQQFAVNSVTASLLFRLFWGVKRGEKKEELVKQKPERNETFSKPFYHGLKREL